MPGLKYLYYSIDEDLSRLREFARKYIGPWSEFAVLS
jgi:hypothetical protein